jgi:hypothetical protein
VSITVAYARRVLAFSHRGENRNESTAAWSVTCRLRVAVAFLVLISDDQVAWWSMYRITCRSRAANESPISLVGLSMLGGCTG